MAWSGILGASFDVWETNHATLVDLRLGRDPAASGPEHVRRPDPVAEGWRPEWTELPLVYGNTENSRGLGVWDMANALRTGDKARANGELGYHVLDIMASVLESGVNGHHVEVESTLERPALLPQ